MDPIPFVLISRSPFSRATKCLPRRSAPSSHRGPKLSHGQLRLPSIQALELGIVALKPCDLERKPS
jgi:hypothetical protein